MDAACVYTNTAPAGSYRAFGATHLQWIGELQVDELARRAGIDPLEVRRQNLCAPGEELRAGGKPLDADLVGDVEKVAAGDRLGRASGAGHRAAASRSACSPPARIRSRAPSCRMEADGNAVVLVGTTEVGQGARTVFAQIAAEELRLPSGARHGARRRHALHARTTARPARAARRRSPASPCKRAAEDVRAQLVGIAGTDDVGVRLPTSELMRPPLRACGRRADRPRRGGARRARAPTRRARSSGRSASAPPRSRSTRTPASCACCKTATVADVGRAINPQLVERQDEGAHAAGHRQRAARGDGLRGRPAAERDPARLPRAELRGPARAR